MSDTGGYVKGIMRRVGVKKGNVISEQENELSRGSLDSLAELYGRILAYYREQANGMESEIESGENWTEIKWTVGDTRTEIRVWMEEA